MLLYFLKHKAEFLVFSFISRFLLGCSVGTLQLLAFALTSEYSSQEAYTSNLSLMEIATSIGLMLGPLIVSILFNKFGYLMPVFICFVLNIVSIYLIQRYLKEKDGTSTPDRQNSIKPKELNFNQEKKSDKPIKKAKVRNGELKTSNEAGGKEIDTDIELNEISKKKCISLNKGFSTEESRINTLITLEDSLILNKEGNKFQRKASRKLSLERKISNANVFIDIGNISSMKHEIISNKSPKSANAWGFMKLILHSAIFPTIIIVTIDMICQSFFYPVFINHFKNKFGMNTSQSSLLFSFSFVMYTIGLRLVVYIIQASSSKFVLCLGVFFNSISVLFFAPATFLPQRILTPTFGLSLLNLTAGFSCVASIINFSDNLEEHFGFSEELADDTASGFYILGINIGELIGPLIGGYVTYEYNFETACFLVGILNISCSIFFFSYNLKEIWISLTNGEDAPIEEKEKDLKHLALPDDEIPFTDQAE